MEWIGVVYNDVKEPTDEGWGAVVSEVVLDETLTDGLDGIQDFSHVLQVHQGDYPLCRRDDLRDLVDLSAGAGKQLTCKCWGI